MELFYRQLGEKGQPVIILHGIFGTADNWQTFGKKLSENHRVYMVDQRNHGFSPHSDKFNYHYLAEDLKAFIDHHHLDHPVILGHSLGGKAAMHFALKYPENFDKLIVVDIAPKGYPVHHGNIIKGFEAVDIAHIKSRREADEQMAAVIGEPGIRQFLLKNLTRNEEGEYVWKLNLPVIKANLENVVEGIVSKSVCPNPALFVKGEKSDFIQYDDEPDIKVYFPNAQLITIPEAGHWIHADKPERLMEEVKGFMGSG